VIDVAFFSASSVKLVEGGWFPLAMGTAMFTIMTTWKRGREVAAKRTREGSMPVKDFIEQIAASGPVRVPNTAIFMTVNPDAVPKALLHNIKHNQVLHERIIVLTIVIQDIPRVPREDYIWIEDLNHGFWRIKGHYGFMETPDVPQLLEDCGRQQLHFDIMQTSFFLNRETLVMAPGKGLARWRRHLFIWMSHLATKASDYYRIPSNRVIELGTQVQI
jgi:KUP system potassium uptake protein